MIEKLVERDFGLKPNQNNENTLNILNTLKKTHTHPHNIYIYIYIYIYIHTLIKNRKKFFLNLQFWHSKETKTLDT